MTKQRNVNLDLIRTFAITFVIGVHFFLNSGFYDVVITSENKYMYFIYIFQTVFMTCVPLFIMLTGYLNKNKTISKKYYFGVSKILGVYVLASLFCIFCRQLNGAKISGGGS